MQFSESMDINPFEEATAVVGGALALAAITIPSAAAQTTEQWSRSYRLCVFPFGLPQQ